MIEKVDSRPQDMDPAIKSLRETGQWTERGLFWSRRWTGKIQKGSGGINMADLELQTKTSADSFAYSKVGEFLLTFRPL